MSLGLSTKAPDLVGLMSGQNARAVILYGDRIKVFDLAYPEIPKEANATEAPRLFWGTNDVCAFRVSREKDVLPLLEERRDQDRACILALMILDQDESEEIVVEGMEILNELLAEQSVSEFAENQLFKAPLKGIRDIAEIKQQAKKYDHVSSLLSDVFQHQKSIQRVRRSWDALPATLFNGLTDKGLIEFVAAELGFFRQAAYALSSHNRTAMNAVKFHALSSPNIRDIKGYREVIAQWLDPITPSKDGNEQKDIFDENNPIDEEDYLEISRYPIRLVPDHVAYKRALAQVAQIKQLVQHLDIEKARKFTRDLVQSQAQNDDARYAAMSLCNIAAYAQEAHQDSFALELTQQAVEMSPEDGWAWGQLAEANLRLARYDEVENALNRAEAFGEPSFAATGRARLLRHQGKLKEAFKKFEDAAKAFAHAEDAWNALWGMADIYRSWQQYETSLALLDDAIQRFPTIPELRYSKGSVLIEIGQLTGALHTFDEAIKWVEPNRDIMCGKGNVFLEIGDTQSAISAFEDAKKKFRDYPEPYKGCAEAFRAAGKLQDALREFSYLKKEFPFDYAGWLGTGDTYRELKRYNLALKELDEAVALFPKEPQPRLKKAHLLKSMGQLEKSLQLFGATMAAFPSSAFAKFGQANLFKELGRFDAALDIYAELAKQTDQFQPEIRNCVAAISVAQGAFDKAFSFLPEAPARTKSEWVAQHIKGMILLKSGRLDEAIKFFESALEKIPFAKSKSYFENALAAAKLRAHKFDEAVFLLPERKDPITHLLRVHAYGGLKKYDLAEFSFNALKNDCPENIIPIRDELGAHMQLSKDTIKHDSSWIFEQECNVLALSSSITQLAA